MPHPDPIVQMFLEVDPEPANLMLAIQRMPRPLPGKVAAAMLLLHAAAGHSRLQDHLPTINRAFREPSSVDLHILFLFAWFRSLLLTGAEWEQAQAQVVKDRILSLITPQTPPEIAAWARWAEGLGAHWMGDARTHLTAARDLIADLPPSSPHYRRLAALRAMAYLEQGMGTAVELPLQASLLGPIYEQRLYVWRAVNSAQTGVIDPALQPPEDPNPPTPLAGPPTATHEAAAWALRLMAEHRKTPLPPFLPLPHEEGESEPAWVTSTRSLLAREAPDALEWARVDARLHSTRRRSVIGFDEYALIRAELACGHGEAARHLLRRREERGSCHYIDDWFRARVELLAGNVELARSRFAKLLQSIETYRASGRLDFETALACEMSPSQLIEISRRAAALPEEGLEVSEAAALPSETPVVRGVDRLIGVSRDLARVREHILQYAQHDAPVLISGETGTGKELVARALHEASSRRDHPFVALNCGAVSDALVESELFGHERGAFTGAQVAYRGLFREAKAGTMFLDEIGDITPKLQLALLRVLESGEIRPIGSPRSRRIACRVVAATNADLGARVGEGSFRQDLLYRLERLQIELPPLRDRRDDIDALARHFLNADRAGMQRAGLTEALRQTMAAYPWPGNVRELRNVLERMRVLRSDKLIYDVDDWGQAFVPGSHRALAGVETAPRAQEAARPEPPVRGNEIAGAATARAEETAAEALEDDHEVARLLAGGRLALRRRQRLEALFRRFRQLKTNEVIRMLGVSPVTARRDLRHLCERGVIVKVTPTACRSSHYYRLKTEA